MILVPGATPARSWEPRPRGFCIRPAARLSEMGSTGSLLISQNQLQLEWLEDKAVASSGWKWLLKYWPCYFSSLDFIPHSCVSLFSFSHASLLSQYIIPVDPGSKTSLSPSLSLSLSLTHTHTHSARVLWYFVVARKDQCWAVMTKWPEVFYGSKI